MGSLSDAREGHISVERYNPLLKGDFYRYVRVSFRENLSGKSYSYKIMKDLSEELHKGEEVLVETVYGRKSAWVLSCDDVYNGTYTLNWVVCKRGFAKFHEIMNNGDGVWEYDHFRRKREEKPSCDEFFQHGKKSTMDNSERITKDLCEAGWASKYNCCFARSDANIEIEKYEKELLSRANESIVERYRRSKGDCDEIY